MKATIPIISFLCMIINHAASNMAGPHVAFVPASRRQFLADVLVWTNILAAEEARAAEEKKQPPKKKRFPWSNPEEDTSDSETSDDDSGEDSSSDSETEPTGKAY